MTAIVWFRQDLRLSDNPALLEAIERGDPIIPVFILPPRYSCHWYYGSASQWWLHHSLNALKSDLINCGSNLVVRCGEEIKELGNLIQETRANSVYWNRRYDPEGLAIDKAIKLELTNQNIDIKSFSGNVLHEPWDVLNHKAEPYKVFTPYWKACLQNPEPLPPGDKPEFIPSPDRMPKTLEIDELNLLPTIDWAQGIREHWQPGELGAHQRLKQFVETQVKHYDQNRDRTDQDATSTLSPHLCFGEISAQQIWSSVKSYMISVKSQEVKKNCNAFLRQIIWRDFAHQMLYHFPHTADQPLRGEFNQFPWQNNKDFLRRWQKGFTGYPIVDAGMRQLWHICWMHNRVRMIVASFLTKDLLIPWQEGAKWFWDTLVDADLANNTFGWQWTAGCGADAAPFFRIFNPVLQGEKFDPDGDYVRQWVPELSKLKTKWIHKPWEAPSTELQQAGIVLGETYPMPIVDHKNARNMALDAYQKIKY